MKLELFKDVYSDDNRSLHLCSGVGVSSYIYVSMIVDAKLTFLNKEYNFSYQNGHTYVSNDYNCPSNDFIVYNECDFVKSVLCIEDLEDAEHLIDEYDLECEPDIILELKSLIECNVPTFETLGLSEDTDDYDFFDSAGEKIDCYDFEDGCYIELKT